MAGNRIQIRRGSGNPGSNLLSYELGWDTTNKALYINDGGTSKITALPLTGGTLSGTLHFKNITTSNYTEGIRLHPSSGGWNAIVFCGTDNTGDSGTSANTWGLYTNQGNFSISKNGSQSGTVYLQNISNAWSLGGSITINGNLTVGNAHATSSSSHALWGTGITVSDTRYDAISVTSLSKAANFFFSNNGTPNTNWWAGIHVAGWTGDYNAWELVGPAHSSDQRTTGFYVRVGRTSTGWGSWRCLLDSSGGTIYNSTLTVTRADHTADVGIIVQNTDSTNPLKLGYIIGASGNGGIYDYTHGAWKVQIAANGTATFNGTATSATSATNATNATNASTVARATFGDSANGTHDANAMTSNGLYYYSSNGPASIGNSTADGAMYVQAYNTNWVGQIAQDYRNGNLFVRGKNNGTWQAWKGIVNSNLSRRIHVTTSASVPSGAVAGDIVLVKA